MCRFIFPKFNLKIEKWKWNEEYRVYVSSLGHFKDEHKKNMPIKINSKTGYCMIETPYGIKVAHRLVLLTFRPIPNAEDLTVDHLNHNKRCNELSNLEWISRAENEKRATEDLFRDAEIDIKELDNKIIQAGPHRFNTLDNAVNWIVNKNKCGETVEIRNTIKRNILKVINKDKKYCNQFWILLNR